MLFHDLQTSAVYWRDQPVTSAYWRGFRIWQAKAESEPLRKGQLRIAGKDSQFRLTGIILPAGNLHLIRKDITTSSKADLSRGNLHIMGHAMTNPGIDNPMAKGSLHLTGKNFTTQQKGTLASRVLNITGKAATFTLSTPIGTLDPSNKAANITLSNGNLTATDVSTAAWISVKSQTAHSSGKYYWEWTLGSKGTGEGICGFGNSASPLSGGANAFFGTDSNGIGLVSNGDVWKSFSNTHYLASLANGDVACLAIDITNHLFWVRKGAGQWNGSGTADPTTGIGGITLPSGMNSGNIFAGISLLNNGDFSTANFGATAFSQTVPSGYSAWG